MRLNRAFLGLVSSLSLALAAQAATTNSVFDWQFSTATNPAPPTIAVNPSGGDPQATFTGPNNTYFFGTGPNGLFGSPTGLWDIEAGQLALTVLDRRSEGPVDFTVVITQFADQNRALYPGTISWSIPGGHLVSEVPVVPQTGNMIGTWYQDTYQWTAVDLSTGPIILDIAPATAGTGLLLDDVQFTILGNLTVVPEPGFGLLAGTGLLALAMRYWPRRKV